jgi:aminoglycoside/choline kinase family phosphotransferase
LFNFAVENFIALTDQQIKNTLRDAFFQWVGKYPDEIKNLPISGSVRKYHRLSADNTKVIGVFSDHPAENIAFLSFTKHFRDKELNVPEIYYEDLENNVYLMEDLGDKILFDEVAGRDKGKPFPSTLKSLYKKAIDHLVRFQIDGFDGLDLSVCVPRASFDRQSVLWDLQYFKYYALKLFNVPYDEQMLEEEFNLLADHLTRQEQNYFLYRDFQTRNILIHKDELYFVDYQGGRRGPLQYDLASILFEAKTDLPFELRQELLEYYIGKVSKRTSIDAGSFIEDYYHFVFIRIVQALAAFGLRGYVENKVLFLKSYPYAIKNLNWLISNNLMRLAMPETLRCIHQILQLEELKNLAGETSSLQVVINSFSYKLGMPRDMSGHGGGFVFDCRALPNPGRLPEFKNLTGSDRPVIQFLEQKEEVIDFLEHISYVIDHSITHYLSRGFNHLSISFGCTGGQHRSVYCAERLAEHIKNRHGIEARVIHKELS